MLLLNLLAYLLLIFEMEASISDVEAAQRIEFGHVNSTYLT